MVEAKSAFEVSEIGITTNRDNVEVFCVVPGAQQRDNRGERRRGQDFVNISFPEDFFILILSLGVVVRYPGKFWDNLDRHIRGGKLILSEINDGSATAVTEDLENIKVGD